MTSMSSWHFSIWRAEYRKVRNGVWKLSGLVPAQPPLAMEFGTNHLTTLQTVVCSFMKWASIFKTCSLAGCSWHRINVKWLNQWMHEHPAGWHEGQMRRWTWKCLGKSQVLITGAMIASLLQDVVLVLAEPPRERRFGKHTEQRCSLSSLVLLEHLNVSWRPKGHFPLDV